MPQPLLTQVSTTSHESTVYWAEVPCTQTLVFVVCFYFGEIGGGVQIVFLFFLCHMVVAFLVIGMTFAGYPGWCCPLPIHDAHEWDLITLTRCKRTLSRGSQG